MYLHYEFKADTNDTVLIMTDRQLVLDKQNALKLANDIIDYYSITKDGEK